MRGISQWAASALPLLTVAGLALALLTMSACDPWAPFTTQNPDDGAAAPDISEHEPDGSAGPADAAEACDRHARAACDRLLRCDPVSFKIRFQSMADCVARTTRICPLGKGLVGLALTAPRLTQCADALVALDCVAPEDDAVACRPIAGALPRGAACGDNSQCQSSLCQKTPSGCGACVDRVGVGAPCTNNCQQGLICDRNKTCLKPATMGQTCSDSLPCRADLECVSSACVRPTIVGAGSACGNGKRCDETQELYCSIATSQCARQSLRKAGQSCDFIFHAFCDATSYCELDLGSLSGTCIAVVKDGDACTNDVQCPELSACRGGVCAPKDPALCR